MLSAVENYGSAAAATHAYVHHHNFSIAAAAAAAGTAAAAAAAVMPSQQAALEHHHHLLAAHSSLNGAGLLLPSAPLPGSLPSPEGSSSISPRGFLTSSSSLVNNKIANNNSVPSGPSAVTMSSTEFLRPHPKQPRYNGSSLTSNSLSSPNNPATSPNSGNDISGSGNGIPLNVRSNKVGNSSLTLSNSPPSRSKYSSEQSGPVNLATSNNNSSGGNSSTQLVKSSPMESLPPPHSPSEREREIIAGMYAAKNLSFPPTDPSTANAVYHYSRALAANRSLYADPTFFVAHSLARGQLHTRPPYLPDQFPTYLHPAQSAYSPPGASSLLGPPSAPSVVSPQLGSPHSASSLLTNSHNSSTNSSLSTTQLPVASERYPHAASSSLHHPSSPHIPQTPVMVTERQQPPYAKEKDMKNVNQLNGKANMLLENQAGFKVPSGKEGSMKHRILTRPQYGEKDIGRHRSPISAAAMRSSNSTNSLTNFTKGSLIELSTGELRRVEDMRTEDFVQSAERSPHLELADSTVVKISSNSHNVAITFSYNKNRSKVDIDASVEHPFFVYGQGWASCNPELTFKTYGLKCQRLQVGDVCISLKPREPSSPSSNSYQSMPQSPSNYPSPNQQYKDDNGPQNLSRKSSSSSNSHTTTIPTTATGTAVSTRLSAAMPQIPPIPGMPSHAPGNQSYEMIHTYGTSPPVSSHNAHHMSPNTIIPQQLSHHQQHQLQRQQIEGHVVLARNSSNRRSPPSPLSAGNRPGSNQQPYYLGSSSIEKSNGREQPSSNCGNIESSQLMSGDQQAAIDASTSRKRRWSWSNPPVQGNEEQNRVNSPKTSCSINS